jgi:hypothetical protein
MKTDDLFQQTTCYLNGDKKGGKVIAVSTQLERRRVCFQIKGEPIGQWMPDLALTATYSTVVTKDVKGYINPDKVAKIKENNTVENLQIKFQEHENHPESRKDEFKLDIVIETEVKNEATKNIHTLEKFVNDAHLTIQNKASSDIAILVKSLKDTSNSIKLVTESALSTVINYSQLAYAWLKTTITDAIELIAYIQKTLSELWSRYWQDRIIDAIRGKRPHHSQAKTIIEKLKIDYPYETDREIAGRIVSEKAIFATITGSLASTIPVIGIVAELIVVKFLDVPALLVEMIYQVGVSYGFDEFTEGIYLEIFSLAFSTMENIFGDLLKGSTPALVIPSATNIMMFSVVGYAACEYYEAKAKGLVIPTDSLSAFMASQAKVAAYSEKILAEEKTIEATVVEAISIKEQLLSNPA